MLLTMSPKRQAVTLIQKMGPAGKGPSLVSDPESAGSMNEALLMAADDVMRAIGSRSIAEFQGAFKRYHELLHMQEEMQENEMESDDYLD